MGSRTESTKQPTTLLHTNKGFSFTQLIIGLGILAILASISFSGFSRSTSPFLVQTTRDSLINAVTYAKAYALTTRSPVELMFIGTPTQISGIQVGSNLRLDGQDLPTVTVYSEYAFHQSISITNNLQVRKLIFSPTTSIQLQDASFESIPTQLIPIGITIGNTFNITVHIDPVTMEASHDTN